ncbi:MAG: hypothetical protein JW840_07685 [Candidatus Thermoplasmatota archaeon]|nr:hypothetical protein [Candidatus Thermoplasmatota archaeon]
MRAEQKRFECAVLFSRKYFSWLLPDNQKTQRTLQRYFPADYEDLLTFSDLNVTQYDILLFAYTCAFLSLLIFFIGSFLTVYILHNFFHSIDVVSLIIIALILVIVPLIVLNLVVRYPKNYVRYIQIHSLGDIPELLSYLVMYLKLVPNLENSMKFAATESTTTLAYDLRKVLWDMEIRVYHGVNDAITHFALRWGRFSEYFKRSLHLLCSAIHEKDEASRIITLDRALDVSLEGTTETMNQFANRLHQPTMILYSIGIMIPLSLVAMLPAAGLIGMKITLLQVFLVYDILLPFFIFLYTRKILLSRPAAFNPTPIPSNHPLLHAINIRHRRMVSVILSLIISVPGIFFLLIPLLFSSCAANEWVTFIGNPEGVNAFFPVTLFIIWGIATAISFYCISVYGPYKRVRDDIRQMEKEFSDALYILGKRISEEKSPEESLTYTAQMMKGTKISEIFAQTNYILTTMHTNFHDALYHNEFGSLHHVYSDRIKALLRLFVEGAIKSQRAMSASLIRVADHLKQLQEVEKRITDALSELISTLQTTMTIFAPLIAGVTLAITMLISRILGSLQQTVSFDALDGLSETFPNVIDPFMTENIRPEYFVLLIGIYLIELVILLTRFTTGINEGDDKATFMFNLGKTLPVSITVFSLTVVFGQFFFSHLVPLV